MVDDRPIYADGVGLIAWVRKLCPLESGDNYIARIVAEAPPLTHEQCDRLAALLRGKGDASGHRE